MRTYLPYRRVKLQEGQIQMDLPGYHQYWNYAEKKGYSGTAVFTKEEPISVSYGIGIEEHDHEGRVITLEYPDFYFVTCYTPNSQDGLARLPYRMEWEDFPGLLKRAGEPEDASGRYTGSGDSLRRSECSSDGDGYQEREDEYKERRIHAGRASEVPGSFWPAALRIRSAFCIRIR